MLITQETKDFRPLSVYAQLKDSWSFSLVVKPKELKSLYCLQTHNFLTMKLYQKSAHTLEFLLFSLKIQKLKSILRLTCSILLQQRLVAKIQTFFKESELNLKISDFFFNKGRCSCPKLVVLYFIVVGNCTKQINHLTPNS